MSRRAGHLERFLCSVLQPTHLVHGKFRFRSLLCLIRAGESCPSYQASAARFCEETAPCPRNNKQSGPSGCIQPHQLWGLDDGSTSPSTAAAWLHFPALPLRWGARMGAGANSETRFLGLAQGHPRCRPRTCTILTQRERETAQPCHHKRTGAL